jgi:hypothetical protein
MIRLSAVTLAATLVVTAATAQTMKPAPAPAAAPAATTPAVPPAATPPAKAAAAKPDAASSTQFPDEAAAKAHCPTDTVVWVNLSSKVYHLAGTSVYGKTKKGAYSCQKDADAGGFHVAKGEAVKAAAPATPAKKP